MMFKALDPVIPYDFEVGNPDDMIRDMIRIRREYGVRRFLITGVGIGVRITGYPGDDAYRKLGEAIREAKVQTCEHDIEIGWWCAPTLKAGNSPYQHLVDITGIASPISSCPLDERFADDMARRVALIAEIAKPYMIQFEDDYQLSNHPGFRMGCFCPLHLQELARRVGVEYTREELQRIFTAEPMCEPELRRQFGLLARDTMVNLAAKIRAAVDRVAPETRMCLCEPGGTDIDGGLSEPVARAFAGADTRPAIRIFGSQYSSLDSGQVLPDIMWHTMYSAEHLPADFELYHETDTYPHTRYFTSAAQVKGMLYGAVAMGCDDTLLYATQYLDDPVEETGYFEMYRAHAGKLNAFKESVQDCELDGWQIIYKPDGAWSLPLKDNWVPGGNASAMAGLLGRMGIPYTTRERHVKLLAGPVVASMSDTELLAILSSAVLIDSTAAMMISARGFGDLLGVGTEKLDRLMVSEEYILPAAGVELKGRRIYNMAFAPAGSELTQYIKLIPQGAEVLTEYRDPTGHSVQPGLTRFVNRRGGRVAVMGCCLAGNNSSNLFSYRKKELLRVLYQWLNGGAPLPAAALKVPNFWLLFNRGADHAVILLNNLTSDPLPGPEIALAPEYLGKEIQELGMDGTWKKLDVEQQRNSVVLPGECLPKEPRVIRI